MAAFGPAASHEASVFHGARPLGLTASGAAEEGCRTYRRPSTAPDGLGPPVGEDRRAAAPLPISAR